MSQNSTEPGHGNSVASWTTVIIILAAFSIGTLFFWLDNAAIVWASAALAVLAPVVGWILKRAGYGVGGEHTKAH
jgi:multisubunit Na+/H+ antiporter MnhG subunit